MYAITFSFPEWCTLSLSLSTSRNVCGREMDSLDKPRYVEVGGPRQAGRRHQHYTLTYRVSRKCTRFCVLSCHEAQFAFQRGIVDDLFSSLPEFQWLACMGLHERDVTFTTT